MSKQNKRDCQLLRDENEILLMENRRLLDQTYRHAAKMRLLADRKGVRCDLNCQQCGDPPCLDYS